MPATSVAQRQLMAIAEHHPGELYKRNRAVLKMSKEELHDFAATKQKGLPKRVKKKKPEAGMRTATPTKEVNHGCAYHGTTQTHSV